MKAEDVDSSAFFLYVKKCQVRDLLSLLEENHPHYPHHNDGTACKLTCMNVRRNEVTKISDWFGRE